MSCYRFEEEEEAISIANASPFGLAGVFDIHPRWYNHWFLFFVFFFLGGGGGGGGGSATPIPPPPTHFPGDLLR